MSSLGKTLLAFALFHSVLQGHTSTGDCWTLPGKSGSVFCGVTAPSSRVLVHTTFCLCSPIVYSPILCKFWQLFGGFNVHLPQEGLCKPAASSHTQVCCTQSPCPCGSPLLTRTSTGDSNRDLGQSLWCLWVLVCTRFCLSPSSISGRYGV